MINLKEINNNIIKKLLFFHNYYLCFHIDRYSKIEIINNFSNHSYYLNDFLNFNLIWNTGIGFGLLGSNSEIFYNLITSIIAVVIIFLIIIGLRSDKFDKIVFSLIIGGAVGNFYDRLIYNAVPDFIDLHYGNFHWFVFNVDIFITIGIIFYLMKSFFKKN